MSSLNNLPDEIIQEVVSYLPGRDVKALRATSKRLCTASARWLFPILYLSNHPLDLQVFKLVAANTELAGNVRELIIDDTSLAPSLGVWNNYRALAVRESEFWKDRRKPYFADDEPFDVQGREWPREPNRVFYNHLVGILGQHHQNLAMRADIVALKEALPRLTALKSLILTNRTADEGFKTGAQSQQSSSPTVRQWRQLGREHRERPPFPPRCDWAWWRQPCNREEEWTRGEVYDDVLQHAIDENGEPYGREESEADTQDLLARNEERRSQRRNGTNTQQDTDNMHRDFIDRDSDSDSDSDRSIGRSIGRFGPNPAGRWSPRRRCFARESRGIYVTLIALSDKTLQSRLTEFRIDASHDILYDWGLVPPYVSGVSCAVFHKDGSSFAEPLIQSLRSCAHLTKLDITIGCGLAQDPSVVHDGTLRDLLASMPHLQDLSLALPGDSESLARYEHAVFPNLRRFRLARVSLWPKKLLGFIRRHVGTLEEVRVEQCVVLTLAVSLMSSLDEIQSVADIGDLPSLVQGITLLAATPVSRLVAGKVALDSVMGYAKEHGSGGLHPDLVFRQSLVLRYSWTYGVDDGLRTETLSN